MSKNNQTYTELKQSDARKIRDAKFRVISHYLTINFRRNKTAFVVTLE